MRNALNYDISLEIYDEKNRFVKDFIKRLNVEAFGEIYIKHN